MYPAVEPSTRKRGPIRVAKRLIVRWERVPLSCRSERNASSALTPPGRKIDSSAAVRLAGPNSSSAWSTR
jgi:hypothetical protein